MKGTALKVLVLDTQIEYFCQCWYVEDVLTRHRMIGKTDYCVPDSCNLEVCVVC